MDARKENEIKCKINKKILNARNGDLTAPMLPHPSSSEKKE